MTTSSSLMQRTFKMAMYAVTVSLLSVSCVARHYTDELQERTEKEVKEKTEKWFAQNKPEANLIECGVMYYQFMNHITATSNVRYTLDNDTVEYYGYLDTDTGLLYHNERVGEYVSELKRLVAKALDLPEENVSTDVSNCVEMPFTRIDDCNPIGVKKAEVERTRDTLCVCAMPMDYDTAQIKALAARSFGNKISFVARHNANIQLESFDGVEERFSNFEFLKAHPNTTLYIYSKKDNTGDHIPFYELYVEQDEYKFVHFTYNNKGEIVSTDVVSPQKVTDKGK